MTTVQPVPVIVQGMGGLGRVAVEVCDGTPGVELVAVVTRRPEAARGLRDEVAALADLGEAGRAFPGSLVLSTIHAIGEELEVSLADGVRAGLDMVTSSGLFHPPTQLADGGTALDALAREYAVRVMAAGVQPGFVLDVLPASVLDLAPGWTTVDVAKPSDARAWPVSTRHMLGMGESRDVLESSVPYPLAPSAQLLAEAVGHQVTRLHESRTARTAGHDLALADETIPAGKAIGFVQECVAELEGGRTIRLRWEPTLDPTDESDLSLRLDAVGAADLSLRLDGSFRRDPYPATAARMLNAAVRGRSLPPGLHLPLAPGLAWPPQQ
ncbi:hypothetical protein KUV85_14490 [Nocardioides panacisoli]|uniref:hypothetical protein n=1 Tax=Nocardioides panacisoli TaxID=627624 RepID=UPI001C637999|nr:hypothetical protein [Nocardioides panacisoli]QYJ03524.1 hypothetical protein KUV85_14490 [Nocardioides panacisoli]